MGSIVGQQASRAHPAPRHPPRGLGKVRTRSYRNALVETVCRGVKYRGECGERQGIEGHLHWLTFPQAKSGSNIGGEVGGGVGGSPKNATVRPSPAKTTVHRRMHVISSEWSMPTDLNILPMYVSMRDAYDSAVAKSQSESGILRMHHLASF